MLEGLASLDGESRRGHSSNHFRAFRYPRGGCRHPLFIVKNFEYPLSGGFVVNRVYVDGSNGRGPNFGWNLLYTPSASRWFDGYVAAGFEVERFEVEEAPGDSLPAGVSPNITTQTRTDFTFETGVKFRAQVSSLSFLTEFWGIRLGIQNKGFFDIDRLTYVIEIGAGVW